MPQPDVVLFAECGSSDDIGPLIVARGPFMLGRSAADTTVMPRHLVQQVSLMRLLGRGERTLLVLLVTVLTGATALESVDF